ncbi:LL-diaminopimelate aminotransferase, chloroplastic [Artemisia annua]|uniref:LL-diaminopimelate aminotransferase, chloroplastic n=1 Tax=Artemisia annua TaxID=35608 RepID=A0A2U1LVR7_ARTAN|nr:LL-diaminopimelate aminotransferase, chloroplastic [Artemisia annua]
MAAHMLKYPDEQMISLGIGDITEPIPEVITSAMAKAWEPYRWSMWCIASYYCYLGLVLGWVKSRFIMCSSYGLILNSKGIGDDINFIKPHMFFSSYSKAVMITILTVTSMVYVLFSFLL